MCLAILNDFLKKLKKNEQLDSKEIIGQDYTYIQTQNIYGFIWLNYLC